MTAGVVALSDRSGWTLVVAERTRQITDEGHSCGDDDRYTRGELYSAAKAYLMALDNRINPPRGWPWPDSAWKPRDRASNLVRAGALLLAEADRLARAGHSQGARAVRREATNVAAGLTRLLAASTTRPMSDSKECP